MNISVIRSFVAYLAIMSISALSFISDAEFNNIRIFIQGINLNTADTATYNTVMQYTKRIAAEGSSVQKQIIENELASEHGLVSDDAATLSMILGDEDTVLDQYVLRKCITIIKQIEQRANPNELAAIQKIILNNASRINNALYGIVISLCNDPDVQQCLKYIIMGTLLGVLPGAGFKVIALLAGNRDITNMGSELLELSILSALDSFFRYGLQKIDAPNIVSVGFAAGASIAIQDVITNMGQPLLLKQPLKPVTGALQAMVMECAKKTFAPGVMRVINNTSWGDMALGPDTRMVVQQHSELLTYIKNSLSIAMTNPTFRAVTATVVSYAVQGALCAAILQSIGLGFYNESLPYALVAGMARGAIEGLYHYSTYKEKQVGILQRMQTGFVAMSVQKYLQQGNPYMSALDVTPLVVQQLVAGAVDGLTRAAGGWRRFVASFF
jgi:hypothetical protein